MTQAAGRTLKFHNMWYAGFEIYQYIEYDVPFHNI
jgi:hypothetical protein